MKERILISGCPDEASGFDTQLLYFTCSSLETAKEGLEGSTGTWIQA